MTQVGIEKLMSIVAQLRNPDGGCPWDLEQTPLTLCPMMVEEAYEIIEAIEREDQANLQEELGDLLLHVVMQAQIAAENDHFDLEQVLEGINNKLIRRHPHVFGDAKLSGVDEVLATWNEIKAKEKEEKGVELKSNKKIVPPSLPALVNACRLMDEKKKKGQKPEPSSWAVEKMEEWKDLPFVDRRERMGKLLLEMTQVAQSLGINPEEALQSIVQREI